MLSPKQSELITAFVDGELSARQRKAALRLLHKSAEARELCRQLELDAQRVRALPRTKLPAEFPLQVMREIARHGTAATAATAATPAAAAIPMWASLAMAASVLAAITAGSYLFFSSGPAEKTDTFAEKKEPTKKKEATEEPKKIDVPRLRFDIAQLREEPARRQLADELRKDDAVRLEVKVKDGRQAVDRLAGVFKENGFGLVLDGGAKKEAGGKAGTYLLYMEDVLPYELTMILQQLGQVEMHAGPNFASLALHKLTADNRDQLASLLHVPVEQLTPPPRGKTGDRSGWGGIFLPGPPTKEGKPKGDVPPPAGPERLAMAFALDDGRPSATSDEVRRFLKARRAPRPGTLQVVFVVREASV